MDKFRPFFTTPIGLFGVFLTLFGLIYLPFSGLALLIALWILGCGILCLLLTRPLQRVHRYRLAWQLLVMAICPGVMAGYLFVNEFFLTDSFVYLIPEGYRGELILKYKLPEGEPVEHEGFKVLFRFDESGVLLSQYEGGKVIDHLNTEYYFVAPDGSRTPIPSYDTDSTKVVIRDKGISYRYDTATWRFYVGKAVAR